jgi:hypothetical protein
MTTRAAARWALALAILAAAPDRLRAQAENVPVYHPVYSFLKRMETKKVITRYHDHVLPLSRREVAGFLRAAGERDSLLTGTDRAYLGDFLSEFRYDLTGDTEGSWPIVRGAPSPGDGFGPLLSRERFFFFHTDSSVSLFFNFLLDVNGRRISGEAPGSAHAEYLQFGGRARGALWGRLGYLVQWTNAQFWGSRELLARDPRIGQSYALGVGNIQNFDIAESHLRYDAGIASVELGRERLLWGNGYTEKLTLSDNVRVFDFIRADVEYAFLRYTFMHAWLAGTPEILQFRLPFDSSYAFSEPVASDKYFAAHRIEFSIGRSVDVGAQEMVIYANRSPDLAYLNPLAIVESVQRSRGERDNVYWAFDVQVRPFPGLEASASILYDDINVPDMFTSLWSDRYAWQAGLFAADPLGIDNTGIAVEYLRIEPYVFSHARSRDGSYTSLGSPLGPRIGPNADAWSFRLDVQPARNLLISAGVTLGRKGRNIIDASGAVVRNVGSDEFVPHRDTDPATKLFLDGDRLNTREFRLDISWEPLNQCWLTGQYLYESREVVAAGTAEKNHTVILGLRTEL